MAIIMASKEKYQKALTKAQQLGTAKLVHPLGDDKYSVLSSDGQTFYRVTVLFGGAAWLCSCRAGEAGIPCYHCGGVWAYRLKESMQPPPVAGTPAGRGATAGERAKNFLWGA